MSCLEIVWDPSITSHDTPSRSRCSRQSNTSRGPHSAEKCFRPAHGSNFSPRVVPTRNFPLFFDQFLPATSACKGEIVILSSEKRPVVFFIGGVFQFFNKSSCFPVQARRQRFSPRPSPDTEEARCDHSNERKSKHPFAFYNSTFSTTRILRHRFLESTQFISPLSSSAKATERTRTGRTRNGTWRGN